MFFKAPGEKIDTEAVFNRTRTTHPEAYFDLTGHLNDEERKEITRAYMNRITSSDRADQLAAANAYDTWAGKLSKLVPKANQGETVMTTAEEDELLASTRIDCHYNIHQQWLVEMQFLTAENLEKIKNIPCNIVNGRWDLLCPPIAAWRLHKALPKSKLFIIPDAAHSAYVRWRPVSTLIQD